MYKLVSFNSLYKTVWKRKLKKWSALGHWHQEWFCYPDVNSKCAVTWLMTPPWQSRIHMMKTFTVHLFQLEQTGAHSKNLSYLQHNKYDATSSSLSKWTAGTVFGIICKQATNKQDLPSPQNREANLPCLCTHCSGTKAGCLSMPLQGCLFSPYCFKLPSLREGPWFHTATQFTEQVSAVREDKLRKLLLA